MSYFTGELIGDRIKALTLAQRTFLSTNMLGLDDNVYNPTSFAPSSFLQGTYSLLAPVQASNYYSSTLVDSVNSVFYNRYLIVEDQLVVLEINAGAITIGGIFLFGIWNGFGFADEIASITLSQPEAFSLSGIAVDTVFSPYEEKLVTATVLDTAPPTILCEVTVVFDSGESITFEVKATVALNILFRPQTPVVEFLSFLTDVITARNGSEQRRDLRQYPRDTLSTVYMESDKTLINNMKNGLMGRSGQMLGFPFWHMSRRADVEPQTDDLIVYVDTEYATYKVDGLCMLYDEGTMTFQTIKIQSFTGSSITLDEAIVDNYTHCYVMPYQIMKTTTPQGWTDYQNHTVFDLEGMMTEPLEVDDYVFDEYDGLGILPYECNLFDSGKNNVKLLDQFSGMDSETGTFIHRADWDNAKKIEPFGIHAVSREECFDLRRIIYALRGRQKTVWVPTFDNDFKPKLDLSGSTVTCEDNGYATYVFGSDYYKYIAVYRDGETPIYTEITNAQIVAGDLVLTVADSLPEIDKDEVKISMMMKSRLNSDTVEMEWLNPDECYCQLNFIAVRE